MKLHWMEKRIFRSKAWAIVACGLAPSLLLFLFATLVRAAEVRDTTTTSSACIQLNSSQDILDCAWESAPEIVEARLSLKQSEGLTPVAELRPNPAFDSRAQVGNQLGDNVVNVEAALFHTFELGGKRGARIRRAQAQEQAASVELLKAKEEVAVEVATNLNRLRQIDIEIEIISEALTTFHRIQRQFRSRPRLSPEQEVGLSVFNLAEADYTLRRASLQTEAKVIKRMLSVLVGRDLELKPSILPEPRKEWPDLVQIESAQRASLSGSAAKTVRTQLQLAEAQLDLAKSESWPNLAVGPAVEYEKIGALGFTTYGIALSLPLPLYNVNGPGRAYARRGVDLAEQRLQLATMRLHATRNALLDKYRQAVEGLKKAPSLATMEEDHQKTEKLFGRGLVASSLVIEAHRQIVDLAKTRHELELRAVEALWRIRALDGRILEEKL